MIVREYIDIKKGIDVQPPLHKDAREPNDSRGTLLKNLLDTFHFLEYKSAKAYKNGPKEMDVTLEYNVKRFRDLLVIKELKKWFSNFTNYDVDIHTESPGGNKQLKLEIFRQ